MVADQVPDYYALMGVSHDADHTTIRKAYRRLAMQWHPDRNHHPDAKARTIELITAWEILSDPEKRAHYDAARGQSANEQIHAVVVHETEQAQAKAATFPEEWEEFERWQGDAWGEFTNTKSVTPRFLFILIGPLVLAALLREPFLRFVSHGWLFEQFPSLMAWLLTIGLFALLLSAFAKLATALSTAIPALAPPLERRPISTPAFREIQCSGCTQPLRVPQKPGRMRITCPKCGHQAIHEVK